MGLHLALNHIAVASVPLRSFFGIASILRIEAIPKNDRTTIGMGSKQNGKGVFSKENKLA
jgi:hypothetical protein